MSIGDRFRSILVQPQVAIATDAVALGALGTAWIAGVRGYGRLGTGTDAAFSIVLILAIVAAHQFPLRLSRHSKVHLSSVAYYLLAVLVPPALAATGAGIGVLAGEMSVRGQRGTFPSDIATQVGRRIVVVLLASIIAHLPASALPHIAALIATGFVLGIGDLLTYPLLLTPMSGKPPTAVLVDAARQSYLVEGTQYLLGFLGALTVGREFWAVALLAVPTALAYLAFTASIRAEDAKRLAEDAQLAAEGALLQVERLAAERAAILGQIAEGIIMTDPRGNITFANDAARSQYGRIELGLTHGSKSQPYSLLTVDGQSYSEEDLPLTRATQQGVSVVNEQWRIQRADGLEVVAQGSATPVLGEDGSRLGAVLTTRDVTSQYELERQKGEFLSALAHDLRTPLTSVKGRIQKLQWQVESTELVEPDLLREELGRIDASSSRLASLISELLQVANMELGQPVRLAPAPKDLVSLARRVAEEQQHNALHPISFQSSVDQLVGFWDPARIERVLANLLSNAIKYSPQGGEITVQVAEEDGSAVLSVTDQGIGIPSEEVGSIFERFHRGRNVFSKIPGTGIGLAAVRSIVEEHRGTVEVVSREREGSTFIVRLPLHR